MVHFKSTFTTIKRFSEMKCCLQTMHAFFSQYSCAFCDGLCSWRYVETRSPFCVRCAHHSLNMISCTAIIIFKCTIRRNLHWCGPCSMLENTIIKLYCIYALDTHVKYWLWAHNLIPQDLEILYHCSWIVSQIGVLLTVNSTSQVTLPKCLVRMKNMIIAEGYLKTGMWLSCLVFKILNLIDLGLAASSLSPLHSHCYITLD